MDSTNFDSLFGDENLDITCPNCNKEFNIKIKQIGSSVTCPHCNSKINLKEDTSFSESKSNINNSLKEFEQSLNDLDNLF